MSFISANILQRFLDPDWAILAHDKEIVSISPSRNSAGQATHSVKYNNF
jgi:hypothetical protein